MSIDKSKLESLSLFISMFFIGHHLSGQPWRAHLSCGLTAGHVRSAPNMDFQHETFVLNFLYQERRKCVPFNTTIEVCYTL